MEEKFPVNKATVAGVVVRAFMDPKAHRANLTVLTNNGDKNQFINVLVSGVERFKNFNEAYEKAKEGLSAEEKPSPLIKISGEAYFSTNEFNFVKNQNYTLIASGSLNNEDKNFILTSSETERADFRKEYNSNNPKTNEVQIRANLVDEPKFIQSKGGKEFAAVNVAHNYVYQLPNKESKAAVMYASIIVPSSMTESFKEQGLKKGDPIQLTGNIQNNSFENKEGRKVYSFNVIATNVGLDLQIKNAREDKNIEKVDVKIEVAEQPVTKPKRAKR